MFRLLNSLCQITGYALNLQNYSKEFMFGTSWAVSFGLITDADTVCCYRSNLRSPYHQVLDERYEHGSHGI
jgi:hypothetical protein